MKKTGGKIWLVQKTNGISLWNGFGFLSMVISSNILS